MLAAEGVVRDAESNLVSVFSILEEFTAPGFPIFVPKVCVLTVLERSEADPPQPRAELRITLEDQEIHKAPVRVDFQDKLRTRMIVTYAGVALPNPGILKIEMLIDGVSVNSVIVRVLLIGKAVIDVKQKG